MSHLKFFTFQQRISHIIKDKLINNEYTRKEQ